MNISLLALFWLTSLLGSLFLLFFHLVAKFPRRGWMRVQTVLLSTYSLNYINDIIIETWMFKKLSLDPQRPVVADTVQH